MRKMICPAFIAAGAAALLAACAQPATPVRALAPGPTPEEVIEYARAQAQYRSGQALGNDDLVMQAANTFLSIAQEILSRQDPRLFDTWVVCQRYRVAGPRNRRDVPSTFEPRFVRDCENIEWRYNQATIAIRRDLEMRIAAADLAIIAQARTDHP